MPCSCAMWRIQRSDMTDIGIAGSIEVITAVLLPRNRVVPQTAYRCTSEISVPPVSRVGRTQAGDPPPDDRQAVFLTGSVSLHVLSSAPGAVGTPLGTTWQR